MRGRFLILILTIAVVIGDLALSVSVFAKDAYQPNKKATKEMISAIISDVREKCKATDEKIIKEGLTEQDVKKVRDFCGLSDKEMGKVLKKKIESTDSKKIKRGNDGDVGTLSYGCWYIGYNTVPSYGDLGLSSASCGWHKSTPYSCKVEKGIACLWGCSNNDPNLGWHEKNFANQAQLESEIYSKGYHRTAGYAIGRLQDYADDDYTRGINNGYRYQVMWYKDTLKAHTEGPEPNPEVNWYGYSRGFLARGSLGLASRLLR